jgi:putative oxidoreductase
MLEAGVPRDRAAPQALIPMLRPLYARCSLLAYPLIRLAAGLLLVPHGGQKLFGWFGANPERLAAGFSKIGFEPGSLWVMVAGSVEFFCGLLIAIGFLTRPAALGATILLAVAVKVQSPAGWLWTGGGVEFALFWAVVTFAIALHGGGRFSLDGKIGREF